LSDLNAPHVWAYFHDLSGNLVAKHHRFAHCEVTYAAFMVIVQVRSANASGPEPDQNLAFPGPRFRPILNL
jgi:hypothetical protein